MYSTLSDQTQLQTKKRQIEYEKKATTAAKWQCVRVVYKIDMLEFAYICIQSNAYYPLPY